MKKIIGLLICITMIFSSIGLYAASESNSGMSLSIAKTVPDKFLTEQYTFSPVKLEAVFDNGSTDEVDKFIKKSWLRVDLLDPNAELVSVYSQNKDKERIIATQAALSDNSFKTRFAMNVTLNGTYIFCGWTQDTETPNFIKCTYVSDIEVERPMAQFNITLSEDYSQDIIAAAVINHLDCGNGNEVKRCVLVKDCSLPPGSWPDSLSPEACNVVYDQWIRERLDELISYGLEIEPQNDIYNLKDPGTYILFIEDANGRYSIVKRNVSKTLILPPVEVFAWDGGVEIVPPNKTSYIEGEKLDLAGFEFYETSGIRYSDGTDKITFRTKHKGPIIDLENKPLTVDDKYVTATSQSVILNMPISGKFEITVMPSYPISITPGYYMYHSGKNVYVYPGKPLVFRCESDEDLNAVVIAACYDKNGALLDVRTADMIVTASSDGWIWITPTEETHKVRAFAWDGIGTISPLSDVVEISRPPVQLPQGSGSAEDPYVINTLDELKSIKYTQGAECRLGRDIDMSGTVWEPFEFIGNFDGAGHKISNISISDDAKHSGLFSLINEQPYLVDGMPLPDVGQGSTIKNLEVEIIHSSEAAAEAGGICAAGYNANIDNCIVRGEISTKEIGDGLNYQDFGAAGGIMANQHGGTVRNCKSYADVSVTSNKDAMAGGIVGNMSSFVGFENAPRISNCESYGHITALGAEGATVYAGGIAGFGERPDAYNRFGVKDCKSYATITSSGLAGGICAVPDADWEIYGNINNSIIEN